MSFEEINEVTLHGDRALQEKRVQLLTNISLMYRIDQPEKYFLLRNMALQIQDQISGESND